MKQRERVITYIVRDDRFVVFVHEDDADPLLESGLQVPGGGVGPGETPHEAALREAREETGPAVDGDPPCEWRHVERDATVGGPYGFRLFWLPLTKAPLVCGSMSALIGRIFDAGAD